MALQKGLAVAGAVAALAAAFVLATGVVRRHPDGMSGTWTLVFSDDFDGSSLDRSKWEPNRYGTDHGGDAPFVRSAEDTWFSDKNVAVRNGNLVITIKHEPKTFSGKTYRFSSGVVQSQQHYLVKTGSYIEARIKVPRCDGCWPAFWTAAPHVWPPELDIFEYFGTETQSRPLFSYHPRTGGVIGPVPYGNPGMDYRDGFHTYGMLWDGYKALPYVDGDAYDVRANRRMTNLKQGLILNLSVERGTNPPPGSQMLVDWVRVWRPGGLH
jgi:beta-glucanase (GH16 family)